MDKRVYMLTTVAFVVGMAELIVGGILDLVASDLGVSVSKAGLLITVFALIFAISAPILLITFSKVERTRLTVIALTVFLIGNILSIISPTFSILMIARIISAASGSLATVLCINLASRIASPSNRGRAIGLVVMGTSGSLVLGLPIGVLLGNLFSWRTPFILIAILTVILLFAVSFFMEKIDPTPAVSLQKQVETLKNARISFAHLTTFFFLAGHFTFYGYLTPYAKTILQFDGMTISILYFVYGIAAVSGGGLSGIAADRFGVKRTVFTTITFLIFCLLVIPYSVTFVPAFWVLLVVWGMMSWGITPPIHSHLFSLSPDTADIQQSLNNAALHLGIAFGTFVGSLIINYASVEQNAHFGLSFVIFSFVAAAFTLRKGSDVVREAN